MKNSSTRGFTLIELLVVIAIIGVLASIVMASLSNARDKGSDAAIKSNLTNMRSQAELIFIERGDYDTFCEDTPVVDAVASAGATCVDSTTSGVDWILAAQLNNGTDTYCVDSTGYAGVNAVLEATEVADGVCDGA